MPQQTSCIRRAEARDAPALTEIMKRSRAYSGAYATILDGYAVTADQIVRDDVFVAERGAAILGFYSLTRRGEPELDLLFVSDDAQGTGLGSRLVAHLRSHAAGLGLTSVRIVSHPPAVGFYERQGATRIGTAPPTPGVAWARPVLQLLLSQLPDALCREIG